MSQAVADMFLPTFQNVTFWRATRCGLPKIALKNSRKSKKSPIFDKKCSCLVMLSSGSTEIWFQPELPGLYILHQEMVIFGIFSNFLLNIHKPHLVARQNVIFWRVGQCMSAHIRWENSLGMHTGVNLSIPVNNSRPSCFFSVKPLIPTQKINVYVIVQENAIWIFSKKKLWSFYYLFTHNSIYIV